MQEHESHRWVQDEEGVNAAAAPSVTLSEAKGLEQWAYFIFLLQLYPIFNFFA
jgi:hypothetical protein